MLFKEVNEDTLRNIIKFDLERLDISGKYLSICLIAKVTYLLSLSKYDDEFKLLVTMTINQPLNMMDKISFAIDTNKKIAFFYKKITDDKPLHRIVKPYRIDHEYIDGFCELRNANRIFRLDRIRKLTVV